MRVRNILLLSSLILLGLAAYSNAIFLPFVHDDVIFIRQNPRIGQLTDFVGMLIPSEVITNKAVNVYYRPFLEFFYRLEYRLFGFSSAYYHAVNIGLHLLNGVLVFVLLRLLFASKALAWLTAAFFILHPVQSEAVACVAGISNLLPAFFMLGGLVLLALRQDGSDRTDKWIRLLFFISTLFLYVLALLSKESSIVFAGMFLLIEWSYRGHKKSGDQWAGFVLRSTGVLTTTFLYFLWRWFVLGTDALPVSKLNYEFLLRLQAIPHTLSMYLQILLFPNDLHYYRNINTLDPSALYFVLLFSLAGLGYVVVRRLPGENRRWAIFGLMWFLIAILPMLNLVAIINEYSKIAAFEHFVYLPAAGFFVLILVMAGTLLAGERLRRVRSILAGGLLMACMLLTLQQNTYWRGEIALFERMMTFEKDFGRGYRLLGAAYAKAGDYDRAIAATEEALRVFRYYRSVAVGELARGFYDKISKELYLELADYAQAKGDQERATVYYLDAVGLDSRDSVVYNLLGACYARRGMLDKAAKYFAESIRFNRANSQALSNLAVCFIQQKRFLEAKRLLERAVAADKNNSSAQDNLAQLLKELNTTGE